MSEVLKFVIPDGSLRNKNFFFALFAKTTQFKDLFRLNFGLKDVF